MKPDEELTYQIAMASYRNMTRGTVAQFSARGISPEMFFCREASTLSAITGIKATFFDSARRDACLRNAEMETAFVNDNKIRAVFADKDACVNATTLLQCYTPSAKRNSTAPT